MKPPVRYRTGEFARRTSVSVRTLRYYDREGLLSPSHRSGSGHRFYSDDDVATLQQILALKFLGFSLREVRAFLQAEPATLKQALDKQERMMEDRRAQLESILHAIEHTRVQLEAGENDWNNVVRIIEVIQMEKKQDWVDTYFTPEQREAMQRLSEASYSDEAKRKLAAQPTWTQEDQKRINARYAQLTAELKRLVATGADPADPDAQVAAELQVELLSQFTQNDPDIEASLNAYWQSFKGLPEHEKLKFPALPWSEEEGAFLQEALRIYRSR